MNTLETFKNHEEFLKSREKTIGSSDIPVLAGLTARYGSTPYSLWRQKTGRDEPWSGNEATWWGAQLERPILYRHVLDHHGEAAARRLETAAVGEDTLEDLVLRSQFRAPDRPWAIAHPDLLDLTDSDRPKIQEAKSTRRMAAIRRDDDYGYSDDDRTAAGVPLQVYLQVQWQLYCAGIDEAGVSVLIDTSDYREYGPIRADTGIQERCLALAERFQRAVERDEAPAPVSWADVTAMWPRTTDSFTVASLDQEYQMGADGDGPIMGNLGMMIEDYHELTKQKKQIGGKIDDIKSAIGVLIGEHRALQTDDGRVIATRYDVNRETISMRTIDQWDPTVAARLREAKISKQTKSTQLKIRSIGK